MYVLIPVPTVPSNPPMASAVIYRALGSTKISYRYATRYSMYSTPMNYHTACTLSIRIALSVCKQFVAATIGGPTMHAACDNSWVYGYTEYNHNYSSLVPVSEAYYTQSLPRYRHISSHYTCNTNKILLPIASTNGQCLTTIHLINTLGRNHRVDTLVGRYLYLCQTT